jgi:Metallo-beta-lactamase superfamily
VQQDGAEVSLQLPDGPAERRLGHVQARRSAPAKSRKLYLTTTHFHPEHAFGAKAFAEHATYLANKAQASDLATKGPGYIGMFTGLGEPVARQLAGVELPTPDLVYDDTYDLDLGGRVVHLRATGRAHTKVDQVITVPDAEVMFTGDLVETGQFAIFPWFPPHDADVSGIRWTFSRWHSRYRAPAGGSTAHCLGGQSRYSLALWTSGRTRTSLQRQPCIPNLAERTTGPWPRDWSRGSARRSTSK